MKTRIRICLSLGFLLLAAQALAQSANRPNVVLIIADDLAWDDSGAYGNRKVGTPNIDRLAREGLKFNRAFVTISSCSPSRSSMITGRYPHNTDAEQLHWPLPPAQVTFVEKLKAAGYWTAASGKWHLGEAIKSRFDLVDDPGEAGFQTDPKTGKMLAKDDSGSAGWLPVMRQRPKDKPFFLWFAALDPHRDYVENSIPKPHKPADVIVPPHLPDAPEVRYELALYYDEITRLDGNVGKVIAELEQQGVADNTLILFISDNGRPFPGAKTTMYDSGIKTPLLARWPRTIRRGITSDSLVSSVDLAPTILQLAGLPIPPTVQGKSFAATLTNPKAKTRDAIYAEKNWHDYEDRVRAVRTERFKYIRNDYADLAGTPSADAGRSPTMDAIRRLHKEGKLTAHQARIFQKPRPAEELYDVVADPQEVNNLANDPRHAKTLTELRAKLKTWGSETNDVLPVRRTPDEFDRETGQPLPNRKRPRPSKQEINRVATDRNGLVIVEAEHFSAQEKTSKRQWQIVNNEAPAATASGRAYLKAMPDTRVTHADKLINGENFSNKPGEMAVLHYRVQFSTPGRYYVWARAYSSGPEDNSIHAGLDGVWPESGARMQWCEGKNTWRWESRQRTEKNHCGEPGKIYLDVTTAGWHTVSFSMREDGFQFDQWLMTTDANFTRSKED
jgi:arylsulfatase A-like enzyme